MALNENVKELIRSVVANDLQKSKSYVKIILENEKSQNNKNFCNLMKSRLQTSSANLIELPPDLKSVLYMEDVSVSFNNNRYFLTDREKEVYENIQSASIVNDKLMDMGIRYLNSTILSGYSGTGKTTFGRYVAYKLGLPFAYLNFAHCISSYLGSTSKNIQRAFEHVSNQRCVFMLDEVDAIGIKRNKQDVGEMSRIVIGLMQSLDMLENGVIVIGATNRLDMIDEALLRRFSISHEVKELEMEESCDMIKMFLNDLNISYNEKDIVNYAKSNRKQSEIIKNITQSIIKMIKEEKNIIEI